jgi:beta-carotene ketolase (CrtO type)
VWPVTHYDVIVAGGGHNGLTCAAYLSRAGKRVLVLEQRDILGGFCTTEETVPEAPGFRMSRFAAELSTGTIPPTVDAELDLAAEGLRWVHPDPFYAYLAPDGRSIGFWRDVRRTVEEIGRFSHRDAEAYARFNAIMTSLWETVAPYMQSHPTRVRPGTLMTILRAAARGRAHLGEANRMMFSSPGAVIEEWFESDELRAAMACYSVSALASLDAPGSGIVMSLMAVKHRWGLRRPVGGAGAYTGALAASIRRHGGVVRNRAPVTAVTLRDGRATGVRLESGEELTADTVIATVDPWTLGTKWLPDGALPDRAYRQLRGMSVIGNNIALFKGDVAVRARPELVGGRTDELIGSTMLLAPSIEYVRAATEQSSLGRLAPEVPMWVSAPSAYDRSMVPDGSTGEGLYLYLPSVPYRLTDTDWSQQARPYLDHCLDELTGYMPDLKDLVIGSTPTSPSDLESISRIHKGSAFHADPTLSQFGPWRPIPAMAGYRTPVPGLLHAGSGNHPMGTVNGWSGRSAAHELLRGERAARRPRLLGPPRR